jgi:predicted RNA binding protein YcfA (HicA-like mRNA interferase family)
MPKLKPVSWRELVKRLRKFGFEGPYQVGNILI